MEIHEISPKGIQIEVCACCSNKAGKADSSEFKTKFFNKIEFETAFSIASGILFFAGIAVVILHLSVESRLLATFGNAFFVLSAILGMIPVVPHALQSLKEKNLNMNVLMLVAVLGAIGITEYFEAAAVAFLFGFSEMLESWSAQKARKAIEKLLDISPRTAKVFDGLDGLDENSFTEKRVEDVSIGSLLLVRPGDQVPLDGEITKGTSFLHEAALTGESVPVGKSLGDKVFAGSINGDGALIVRSTCLANDTTVARIVRLVEEGQQNKAHIVRRIDKFANVYTPLMLLFALSMILVPMIFMGKAFSSELVYSALYILVLSCPCALVLSTPISITAALAVSARKGILLKGGVFLEVPARVDTIVIDKTGTLTTGKFSIKNVTVVEGAMTVVEGNVPMAEGSRKGTKWTEERVLSYAAALESFSSHPIGFAIQEEAKKRGLILPKVLDAQAVPGRGAKASMEFDGEVIEFFVGSKVFVEESLNMEVESKVHAVYVWNSYGIIGSIEAMDSIKADVMEFIQETKELGIKRIVMLTGDSEENAQSVVKALDIEYKAGLLPEDKAYYIENLQKQGATVLMVGDGINDAPALSIADLGVAMGSTGSDIAVESADCTLIGDDLRKIPFLIRLSQKTLAIIRINIVFAVGIKLAAASLAFTGAAPLWLAVVADVGTSLIVILHSLRMLNMKV